MSDNIKYDNIICDAISIIANKKIGEAPYDKTIRGVIKGKSDTDGLAYTVLGQGTSQFIAYNANPNIEYEKDDVVYILVPGNDMSRKKTIISSANDQQINYTNVVYLSYDTNGPNAISINDGQPTIFKLNSYKEDGDRKVLYDYNKTPEENAIQIDNDSAKEFITESGAIYLSVDILMNDKWDSSQVGGNYNAVFSICFKNKQTGEEVVRDYQVGTLDVLRKNPDSLFEKTTVYEIIEDADVANFDHIESISIYVENYPSNATKGGNDNYNNFLDLQFSNFFLQGVNIDDETKVGGYNLHLDVSSNKNGKTVTENDNVVIEAQIKEIGRIINPNANEKETEYFWFVENNLVVEGHPAYHPKGGKGWQCLNTKSGGKWITMSDTLVMTSQVIPDGATNYYVMNTNKIRVKCVVHYGNQWLDKNQDNIITIKNTSPTAFQLSISSSDKTVDGENRTVYYLNHGSPTLTCNVVCKDTKISTEDNIEYLYNWTVTTGKGLLKTEKQPSQYTLQNIEKIKAAVLDIQRTVQNIDREEEQKIYLEQQNITLKLLKENGAEEEVTKHPADWITTLKEQYLTSYVDGPVWYNVPIYEITNKSTFTCTVYYQTINEDDQEKHIHLIGTASIDIYNKRQLEGEQNLIINNGTQVFHYDDKGLSPAAAAREKPQKVKPLTFTWLDSSGEMVAQSQLDSWCWYVPINDTMITCTLVGEKTPTDENKQYYLISNVSSLPYTIDDNYDPKKKNNTIKLHAKLKDNELDAYTSLTFAKDGNPGTNGTKYTTKIVPVGSSSERLYLYNNPKGQPMVYDDTGVQVKKLKFYLYSGGEQVNFTNEKIKWEILKPSKNSITYLSFLETDNDGKTKKVNSITGPNEVVLTGQNITDLKINEKNNLATITFPYDIVRASVVYDGFNHIAEFPINVVNTHRIREQEYRIKIKPLTGFEYAVYTSDGRTPDYDNTLPFEIQVERLISTGQAYYWEHIEDTDKLKYMYVCTPALSIRSWDIVSKEQKDVIFNGTIHPEGSTEEKSTWELFKDKNSSYGFINKAIVTPADNYDGESLNESFTVIISFRESEQLQLFYMNVPIYLMLNRYGNAALNKWDGNSIQIDESEGHILAPQFGAGKKDDTSNTFTGVLMGNFIKGDTDQTGIMAFDKGVRTVFIDAESGKSEFGKSGAGRIVIDPSLKVNNNDAGLLYSGNYKLPESKENSISLDVKTHTPGQGMVIDLSTPQIGFGNGNFYVTETGDLHSVTGDIGGWKIHADSLESENKHLKLSPNEIVFKNSKKDNQNILFKVSGQNQNAEIAGWNFDTSKFYKGNVGINSVANTTSAAASTVTVKNIDNNKNETKAIAFYAGKDNLFYVTHDGYLKSQKGNIGGWEITPNQLKSPSGKMVLEPGSISIGDGFSATDDGAKIGGWIVNSNSIQSDGKKGNSQEPITVLNNDGSIVTDSLQANKGSIGGITIGNKVLYGTGFYLGPNGCHFTGLTVTNNGVGIGTVSNGGSGSYSNGGSGSTVARFGGSGSYVSPSMRTGRNDTQTWEDYIDATIKVKRLQGGAVRTGNFSVLEGYNAATDTGSGAAIFTVSGNTVSFSPNCQILVSNKQGLTTQVDIGGLKLTFTRGILTNKTGSYTPPTNTGSTGG